MPAKWQMVGINHEHTAHMAANSPTCLLSSQDSFGTLFAERNRSPLLQNHPQVSLHQVHQGQATPKPHYKKCNAALSLCLHRPIMYDAASLRGNTTV